MDAKAKDEDRRAKAEAEAKKRLDDARAAAEAERQEHLSTMATEAEKSRSELDKVLDEMKEPEKRTIRLEAYKLVLSGEYDPGSLQSRVDDTALRLARYVMAGKV